MSTLPTQPLDLLRSALQWEVSAELNKDAESRREHEDRIRSFPAHIHRLAAVALHTIISYNPELAREVLIRPYTQRGFEVIGLGGTSTVTRMGDQVLKVLWTTRHQTESEKADTIRELESDQGILASYLDDYALGQTFETIPYPLKPADTVVVGLQPFVQGFQPLPIYDLEGISNSDRDLRSKLTDFTAQALEMADEYGCVPDFAGDNNIGLEGDGTSLVLVDTLPKFKAREPDIFETSKKYVERVAYAASSVRQI